MGIPANYAWMLLQEHMHKKLSGKLMSIGRQTIMMTPERAVALVRSVTGDCKNIDKIEVDKDTRAADGKEFISDRSFYRLFSDLTYHSLDVTDYEGADIVMDLCDPLDPKHENQYDIIINGSCLDNIFDPAAAMKNMTRLLKPGGRVIHLEWTERTFHAYIAFSLAWFHDYYSLNNFNDCKVYMSLSYPQRGGIEGLADVFLYRPLVNGPDGNPVYFGQDQHFFKAERYSHAYVIAEKGTDSTWEKNPVQAQYRNSEDHREYMNAAYRFEHSPRPVLKIGKLLPPHHEMYFPIGSIDLPSS